jgi:hypothetical protein
MWGLLESIENSGFSIWLREAPTVLAYPTVLALHAIGMAFLVGLNTMIALRILGFASGLPLAPMDRLFKVMFVSFWVNAISGLMLTALQAVNFMSNPTFYIKMAAVAAGVLCMRSLRTTVFGDLANVDTKPIPARGVNLAILSLCFWFIAVVAGRLIAYSFYVSWRTIVAVSIALTLFLVLRFVGARLVTPSTADRRVPGVPSTVIK